MSASQVVPRAVLFDLGGTLVSYYEREEFPGLLEACLGCVLDAVTADWKPRPTWDVVRERALVEDFEAEDHAVRPLERRLVRLLAPGAHAAPSEEEWMARACEAFLAPIFERARLFDDVLETLDELRGAGLRLALVSNTPWGSPAGAWRAELRRLGLAGRFDAAVFCRDVGFRKPHRRPFEAALAVLEVEPEEAVFVGDDPRWDVEGPRRLGVRAVLVDRAGRGPRTGGFTLRSLRELTPLLGCRPSRRPAR